MFAWWARRWYVDHATYVLCVTMPPPEGAVYSNVTLHKDRGWCFFEVSMASVVKNMILGGRGGGRKGKHPVKECPACRGKHKAHTCGRGRNAMLARIAAGLPE